MVHSGLYVRKTNLMKILINVLVSEGENFMA